MNRSETTGKLAEALAKAQGEFGPVPKNKTAAIKTKTGGEYRYKYADLADVLKMALPILAKNGIAFTQPLCLIDGKLRLTTKLTHISGEWEQSDGIEISELGTPQEFGSEHSYFRRYDGTGMLGIAPDEDTDGSVSQRGKRSDSPTFEPRAENEFAPKAKTAGQSIAVKTPFSKAPIPVLLDAKQRQMFWADAKKVTADEETIRQVIQEVTGQDTTKGVHIHETGAILIRLRELMAKERGEVNPFDEEVIP
jgi:hypothetical protein